MLKLFVYENANEIYESLKEINCELVVPGPEDADLTREFLPLAKVITASNFLNKKLKGFKVTRKSELIKTLGDVWQKKVNSNYAEFKKYYKYFTEIRNNTPNYHIFEEVCTSFEERYSEYLRVCYLLLEQLDIYDEFRAYETLSKDLNESKETEVFFLNFKHLTSIQVDFLQNLSKVARVNISLPKHVWEGSGEYTWPKWMSFDEVVDLSQKEKSEQAEVVLCQQENRGEVNLDAHKNIFINDSNIFSLLSLRTDEVYSKAQADYFLFETQAIFLSLESMVGAKLKSVSTKLKEYIVQYQAKGDVKSVRILIEILKEIDVSEDEIFDFFKLCVLREVVTLNSPRNYWVSLSGKRRIQGLGPFYIQKARNIYFYDSTDVRKKSFEHLPQETLKSLGAIGFYNSEDLENLFFESFLKSFMSQKDNQAYVQPNQIDEFEKLLPSNFESRKVIPVKTRSFQDIFNTQKELKEKKKHSPSSLQLFLTCKRKYYFTYNERMLNLFTHKQQFKSFEEGRLTHEILEDLIDKKEVRDLPKLVEEKLGEFKDLDEYKVLEAKDIIAKKVQRGSLAIEKIIKDLGLKDYKVEFERKVSNDESLGFIDIVLEDEDNLILLDFKRSKGSIPLKSEVLNLKKIQILFYLKRLKHKKNLIFGYIALDNIDNSLMFTNFHSSISFGKTYEVDVLELMERYEIYESKLIESVKSERDFLAIPSKVGDCQYCEMSYLCQRSLG